ncbi:methyltransferase domain-containing protein [Streptosporangium fragile]|uniref:Methyltransferase domain-containing protein n=1 Tax=Streptosporangium fragile TaxID=46186 RepID=A0ABN3W5J3_9ACTN
MVYEAKVREFYDSAFYAYQMLLQDRWHHGDPDAEARGLSAIEACEVLERKVVGLAGIGEGSYVLDFGSGIGGPTLYMTLVSNASFVGVTNNERLSAKAREKALAMKLSDRARFITVGDTDYKNLPFPSGGFDAVTFYESVCHLDNKAAFFREAFRILRPGGRLAGIDWLQRPFGEHRTAEQIAKYMQPVNDSIIIPWHGTVDGYQAMMTEAGFSVMLAVDMFEGVKCWGSTPDEDRPAWLNYEGPSEEQFRQGKRALDAAREAGVFTVGMFAAEKPAEGSDKRASW